MSANNTRNALKRLNADPIQASSPVEKTRTRTSNSPLQIENRLMIAPKKVKIEPVDSEYVPPNSNAIIINRDILPNFNILHANRVNNSVSGLIASNSRENYAIAVIAADEKKNFKGILYLLHPQMLSKLKLYQKQAIEFMSDRILNTNAEGVILAHKMGLGKTFTTIAFLHAVLGMDKADGGVSRILIVAPKNTIQNWKSEFAKWLPVHNDITILDLEHATKIMRNHIIANWSIGNKQILLIGYEMFCIIEKNDSTMSRCAELVIFDEAHRLKNNDTQAYKLAKKIETPKKIFLTGTPLQNNLIEFHTLVDFICPNLLFKKEEFNVLFAKPIEAGKAKDVTAEVAKRMQCRCQILYKLTKNVVHRVDDEVLAKELKKEKSEATFIIRPSNLQKQLLIKYLENVRQNPVKDDAMISKILTHPDLCYFTLKNKVSYKPTDRYKFELSAKITILLEIINYCESVGDKLIVFSQYLETLNYIEKVLAHLATIKSFGRNGAWGWNAGQDYLRIDGSVAPSVRDYYINSIFNKKRNPQARLMLISTKAGSLGTNMVGANRVVIFDSSWNPSNDIQSLHRVYRYGQEKSVHIYRFVTKGTIEESVYNRQIAKEATSHRVIDEANIERHFTVEELEQLFRYLPNDEEDVAAPPFVDECLAADNLIKTVVERHEKLVISVTSHDILFKNSEQEQLSAEDFTAGEKEYYDELDYISKKR